MPLWISVEADSGNFHVIKRLLSLSKAKVFGGKAYSPASMLEDLGLALVPQRADELLQSLFFVFSQKECVS